MILTVNIGNTHITIAGYEHDALQFCFPYITSSRSGSRAAFWAVWCPR